VSAAAATLLPRAAATLLPLLQPYRNYCDRTAATATPPPILQPHHRWCNPSVAAATILHQLLQPTAAATTLPLAVGDRLLLTAQHGD